MAIPPDPGGPGRPEPARASAPELELNGARDGNGSARTGLASRIDALMADLGGDDALGRDDEVAAPASDDDSTLDRRGEIVVDDDFAIDVDEVVSASHLVISTSSGGEPPPGWGMDGVPGAIDGGDEAVSASQIVGEASRRYDAVLASDVSDDDDGVVEDILELVSGAQVVEDAPSAVEFLDEDVSINELSSVDELSLDDAHLALDEAAPDPVPARPRAAPPRRPMAPPVPRAVPSASPPAPPGWTDDDPPTSERQAAPKIPTEIPLEQRLETPTAIERALRDLGEVAWESRVAVVSRALDACTDPQKGADLSYELGELCERRLADEARAVKAYGRALAADPSLRANLWAIRRVFYRRGLWPNLLKLIDAELRFARDDRERSDLLTEKAAVLSDRLGQRDAARAALEHAIDLDPAAMPPLMALERIATVDGDDARLVRIWGQLAQASIRPERKVAYLLDLIRFWIDQGNDLERARALVDEARALESDVERVELERLRIAELGGDPDELLAALDIQAELLAGRIDGGDGDEVAANPPGAPPTARVLGQLKVAAIRRRQAQIARAAGDGARAWDYLQRALDLAPERPLILADLSELAEELGRHRELAELLARWRSIEPDPHRGRELGLRRVEALLRAEDRDAALALVEELERETPGAAAIAAVRERDALGAQDFAALATAWVQAGDALAEGAELGLGVRGTDAGAAIAAYVAAATIWLDDVGGESGDRAARGALERALALDPRDPVGFEAWIDLHDRTGRVDEAAAALIAALDGPAGASAMGAQRLLARLGRLYRSHGRVDDAVAVDRRRWAADPENLAAAWRIEAGLDASGAAEERLTLLLTLAEREPDPARRGYALVTAARLADSLGRREQAVELYRAVVATRPDDELAHAGLRAQLRRLGRWSELADALVADADRARDAAGAARALSEAAWLVEERLGQPGRAHGLYRRALDQRADDRHACAGAARTALAAGDPGIRVETLEVLAEDAPPALAAPMLIAVAEAQEQAAAAGRAGDDALETYRRALEVAAPRTVAGALAAVAALDLAVARGDSAARVVATQELAERTVDGELAAALHEDLGWLHALVLEDFDRAAAGFEASLAIRSDGVGALLGAALVAARQQDLAGLARTLRALAAVVPTSEVAVALRLRAAAIAHVLGDAEQAAADLRAARHLAPDRASELDLEPAPMGVEAVEDDLIARAERLARRALTAPDPRERIGDELDRADALEAAGRLREAGAAIAAVLRRAPGNLRALDALRRIAARGGDRVTMARAAVAQAQHLRDAANRRSLYLSAAAVFDPGADGAGADPAAAIAIYRRILADDPRHAVFGRLRELLRSGRDVRGLSDALDARLAATASDAEPGELVTLLLERAQLRHELGDAAGARRDLDELLVREPGHAAALELRAGIAPPREAAELWRRYLAAETRTGANADRRDAAALALAGVLEGSSDLVGAIDAIDRVLDHAPDDVELRERALHLATRGADWARVARELRQLIRLRATAEEQAGEELRLGEVLRDRLGERGEARAAFERGRALDPLNLDLIRNLVDLLRADAPDQAAPTLARAAEALRSALEAAPDAARGAAILVRLEQVLAWQQDTDGRCQALNALELMATPTDVQREALVAGRQRPSEVARGVRLDAAARAALRAPGAAGVIAELWRAASSAITIAAGFEPARWGFARGDRVAMKTLGQGPYQRLAVALTSFSVEECEIFVRERGGTTRVLSAEVPVLCVDRDVARGETARDRAELGRAAWLAAEGTGTAIELDPSALGWFLIAALRAAEVAVPRTLAGAVDMESAMVERTRLVSKHLARRDKKAIQAIAPRLGDLVDPADWRTAVDMSGLRAGLWFSGDVGAALGRSGDAPSGELDRRGLELATWSVSPDHLELRRRRSTGGPP